jgi:hypothetical protein
MSVVHARARAELRAAAIGHGQQAKTQCTTSPMGLGSCYVLCILDIDTEFNKWHMAWHKYGIWQEGGGSPRPRHARRARLGGSPTTAWLHLYHSPL